MTWGIAISAGLCTGFAASKIFPMPAIQFDDRPNFSHVVYGDDTAKYNDYD